MIVCKVPGVDGSSLLSVNIEYHRCRNVEMGSGRMVVSRLYAGLLGLLCIGSGVATYWKAA